ncbi:putative fungal Zn(2)-cys(6) binuclear cluster domain protein [Rhizoctonia solani 123E]|uniref:Putative fungal Zn(2)-cys(6) binuclear cluster domain protein n=1 Tax=Rhizoctonia solani 123E TaxID=1423351 RepID=A0A074RQ02_9AGAM|nr:putative fungal Zn(2)-cys(6) binuclear cluster domain protein [Rhizoctonia solani 123E]
MSIRSATGCYACKTRRKKCDETKPKCLRCMKSRIDCEYSYLPTVGRSTKKKTRPAPRPMSEHAKKIEKQKLNSTIPESTDAPEALNNHVGLFDHPLIPSLDISLPSDSDWEAVLHLPATVPSLDPLEIQALPCSSVVSQQPLALPTANLTSAQASLLNALFSLGEANHLQQSNFPSTHALTPYVEQNAPTPDFYDLTPYSRHALISDSQLYESEGPGDDEDIEGVVEIFIQSPLVLDRTLDSNSLPFVLQSFAQWFPWAVFDPLKIIHAAKDAIITQFSQSPTAHSRILLISELMAMLTKSWTLDEQGKSRLQLLRGGIWQNLMGYQAQRWPLSEEERQRANAALDHTLELITIQVITTPLSTTLHLLQAAAPVFLSACAPPHPPHLLEILLEPGINLRNFAAADIATSVMTGKPLLCRYHIPWSLELCDEFMRKRENQGLQWLLGIPDQFIMLFGYMARLKEDAEAAGTFVSARIIQGIEEDMREISILPCESRDASLAIGRMVVQECWREAVFIYLYMALCGAHALDPRVAKAQKGFMKLVNGIRPGRKPDAFLVIPMLIAGVAITKPSHRQVIRSRILGLPNCATPNTAGHDSLLILEDVWAWTEMEGRVARWEDLREACRRVTGI